MGLRYASVCCLSELALFFVQGAPAANQSRVATQTGTCVVGTFRSSNAFASSGVGVAQAASQPAPARNDPDGSSLFDGFSPQQQRLSQTGHEHDASQTRKVETGRSTLKCLTRAGTTLVSSFKVESLKEAHLFSFYRPRVREAHDPFICTKACLTASSDGSNSKWHGF